MLRSLALLLVSLPLFPANVQLLTTLPIGAVKGAASSIQLDSASNIYIAGTYYSSTTAPSDGFIAKISADGSQLIYFARLGGSGGDAATALAIGPDGSAYVAGVTASPDFPVTPGAFETSPPAGSVSGFLAKVSPTGAITYATYINGVSGGTTQITGMALDAAGEVFLTGLGGPQYSAANGQPQGFILKMDAAMSKFLISEYGYGGGFIQLDTQGNIFVAGSAQTNVNFQDGSLSVPSFPAGAYRTTVTAHFCETFGSGPGGIGGSLACRYQYVAKLDPSGKLIWGTYVSGSYGAITRGMSVDSSGNVIVAGATYSDDYPVTSTAFQTAYTTSAPPYLTPPTNGYKAPPPTIGFVSKVNSTGTSLIWSTYFGGSFADQVSGLSIAPSGDIFISGRAGSVDLPGLEDTPAGCRPSAIQELGFVARLSPDGATAGPTQLVTGAPDCSYLACPFQSDFPSYTESWPLAMRSDGTLVTTGTAGTVASVNFAASSRLACITDPADNVQLQSVAPGQLLTLFGNDLAPAGAPTNFSVSFNGTPAPVLYAAGPQINVQVPYEIAGQSSVQMKISDNLVSVPVSETHAFGVVARQPSIFLSPDAWQSFFPMYSPCGNSLFNGEAAFALNADGTVNSCTNPAAAGSTVTLFVNGLGQVTPTLATGAIAPSPAVPITPGVSTATAAATTSTIPGSISGIAQVQIQVPAPFGSPGAYQFNPSVSGVPLREQIVLIWTRPN